MQGTEKSLVIFFPHMGWFLTKIVDRIVGDWQFPSPKRFKSKDTVRIYDLIILPNGNTFILLAILNCCCLKGKCFTVLRIWNWLISGINLEQEGWGNLVFGLLFNSSLNNLEVFNPLFIYCFIPYIHVLLVLWAEFTCSSLN